MIEQFINFVIRPPRANYNPDQYLWDKEFTLAGRKYQRQDLEIRNTRGHILKCSHYMPSPFPENISLPCVIYCHGNSGCRADANEAAVILLPSNITVFTLDFSGSGLSDGDYVSLGWHEKSDLKDAVSYLRSCKGMSCIGLWGRSMGAVTSLLYGAEDPSIAGIVLDSAFSNLFDLMMELVDVYKIRLPKFTRNGLLKKIKLGVQYMRRAIQRRAKFDIMDLKCSQVAPKTFIPALFGHATDDVFIQPHHTDVIFKSYAGDKNVIKFEGDHNSPRPQFYYDSVSIFFFNVLRPPQIRSSSISSLEKYYDFEDLKVGEDVNESLLYEIIAGMRVVGTDTPSSSSAPSCLSSGAPRLPVTKCVADLLTETGELTNGFEQFLEEAKTDESDGNRLRLPQDKVDGQNGECCSYSSSNRESWGKCSSLGVSDDETSSMEGTKISRTKHQLSFKVLATPFRRITRKPKVSKEKPPPPPKKKKKRENFKKIEAISQKLGSYISRRVKSKEILS